MTKAITGMSLVVVLGAIGMAVAAGRAEPKSEPLSCAIGATPSRGLISLEAIVKATRHASGSYEFRVVGSGRGGSSNVQQGGPFEAGPGGPVTLGRVMIGAPGAAYQVTLKIMSNGKSIECSEQIGGAI